MNRHIFVVFLAMAVFVEYGRAQTTASLNPPAGPAHCIAEWEESEGIIMRWHNPDLIKKIQPHNKIYIPVDDEAGMNDWISYLDSNGITLLNIEFLFIRTDSRWTRDYGPYFIWDADNEMGVVDYIRYPSQPWDELFNWNFSQLYGMKFYDMNIHHIGGNWYPNSYGTAFSSSMVYQENIPMTRFLVDRVMHDYLGIDHYHTVTVAPESLEHLDCWVKPCNPETLLVVQFPQDDEYVPYGEDLNDFYATLESPWGRPYRIVRLPMFRMGAGMWLEFRPYMNSLVSNDKVYMPICYHPDDEVAKDVFEEAFPGYEVIGADHLGTGWGGMSIHCSTRNFHSRELIRIYPRNPPGDTEDTANPYTIRAEVIPPNGSSLLSGYPVIRWTDTGSPPFNEVVMTHVGQPNEFIGDIPAHPQGSTIDYYIEARDDGGRSALYPLVAPDGMMDFEVRADTEPPELSRFLPARCAVQWPPGIRTLCKDDMATPEVRVEYEINGTPQPDEVLTREHMCYWYSGTLGGNPVPGDLVTYRIVASDGASNESRLPKVGDVYCPVDGQGSVAIIDMSQHPRTGPFIAKTLGDLGIPYTHYTSWPSDWSGHDVWFICLGIFAYNHVLSASEAADIVSAFQAGKRIYMESGDAWCYDPEKTTLDPWFKVIPKGDGGELFGLMAGEPGTMMDGIRSEYIREHDLVDVIDPSAPAELLFKSHGDGKGRVVVHDAGSYRSVASAYALGGLYDGIFPGTRKEILVRYLQFFGVEVDLYAGTELVMGENLPLRIKGDPGDAYLLLGSLADNYVNTVYGTFRLDPSFLFHVWQGVIPAYGVEELLFPIPRIENAAGYEIHLQAVVGEELKPGMAELTNREILTISN